MNVVRLQVLQIDEVAILKQAIQQIPRLSLNQQPGHVDRTGQNFTQRLPCLWRDLHHNLVRTLNTRCHVDIAGHANLLAKVEHRNFPQAFVLDLQEDSKGLAIVDLVLMSVPAIFISSGSILWILCVGEGDFLLAEGFQLELHLLHEISVDAAQYHLLVEGHPSLLLVLAKCVEGELDAEALNHEAAVVVPHQRPLRYADVLENLQQLDLLQTTDQKVRLFLIHVWHEGDLDERRSNFLAGRHENFS
mmetsp:Transcript_6209/g.11370  ORF Transcript_6209/g.11370 Transcript_6209/m.11370 type:complete len:247 (+) Transcript_6209:448-1188(+)